MHGLCEVAPRILRRAPRRVERVHGADDERRVRLERSRRERLGVCQRSHERLLAQDAAHSGRDRGSHLLGVHRWRAADRHDLDGRIVEQLLDRCRPERPDPRGDGACDGGIHIHHVGDRELVAQTGERREVNGLRHRTRADDADSERGHALAPGEMKHGILTA